MTNFDTAVIPQLDDWGVSLLETQAAVDEMEISTAPSERDKKIHEIRTAALQEEMDAIKGGIRDLIDTHQEELEAQERDFFTTKNATFWFQPSHTEPKYLIIEPSGSFRAIHNGERVRPSTVKVELAPHSPVAHHN